MRYLKYLALLAILLVPATYSHAQVSFSVGVGGYYPPAYEYGPPVCTYGYYNYYPYACAPYGYYGPEWFLDGVFIGAGPWYHGYRGGYYGRGYRGYAYAPRGYYGRGYVGRGYEGRGYAGRGYEGHGGYEGRGYSGGSRGFSGGGGGRGYSGGGHGGRH